MAFCGAAQGTPMPTEDFQVRIMYGEQVISLQSEINVSNITIAQVKLQVFEEHHNNQTIPSCMSGNPDACRLVKNDAGTRTVLDNSSLSSILAGFDGILEIWDSGTQIQNEVILGTSLHHK